MIDSNGTSMARALTVMGLALVVSSTGMAQAAPARSPQLDTSPVFSYLRTDDFASFGASSHIQLGRLGDLDGDRLSDYAVGLPSASPGGRAGAGVVEVISGVDGSTIDTLEGTNAGDALGAGVADLGDVNGDGIPDFAAGARGVSSYAGVVYVFSGSDRSVLYTIDGTDPYEYVGQWMAAVPDADGDGIRDLLVGRITSGSAYADVLSGSDGSLIHTLGPMFATTATYLAPAPASDIDGDGVPDWLVYDADINFESSVGETSTYAYSGADGGLLFSTPSFDNHGFLDGTAIAAGDQNDDQLGDLWMGSSGSSCGGLTYNGAISAYRGPDGGTGPVICGEANSDYLGHGVVQLPDFDLDGSAELVVGAPGADAGGLDGSGRIYLLRGRDGSILGHAEGTEAHEGLGSRIANVGDITGDGRDDIGVVAMDSGGAPMVIFYSIDYGPAYVSLLSGQGFDICAAPSLEEMQAWSDYHYQFVGIYMEGINRGCPQKGLDASWISAVRGMGWKLAPIWPGRSAPCRTTGTHFDSNAGAAEAQGKQEADDALQAAQDLGLVGPGQSGTVIYMDVEPPPPGLKASDADCAPAAADAFISGWVGEMQLKGNLAGVYSSTEYASRFAVIPNIPDTAWIAAWVDHAYDASATLTGIPGISDSLWLPHRRVHQYAGNVKEPKHNGVGLTVDANIADAPLAKSAGPGTGDLEGSQSGSLPPSFTVHDMKLLTPSQGWVWANQSLLWSSDGGSSWTDITPAAVADKTILAVDFSDLVHGWVASVDPAGLDLYLSLTTNGGATWDTTPFSDFGPDSLPASIHLDFVDQLHGWMVIRLASSSNASDGVLFGTSDGGNTWAEMDIPSGNPVRFLDVYVGWTLGGPGQDELYRTDNGGSTWSLQTLSPPPSGTPYVIFDLPTFTSASEGTLPVIEYDQATSQVDFYQTVDEGTTWNLVDTESTGRDLRPGSVFPISVAGPSTRYLPLSSSLPNIPSDVVSMTFVSPEHGWVFTSDSECSPSSTGLQCDTQSSLQATTDGGQTWQPLSLDERRLFLPLISR